MVPHVTKSKHLGKEFNVIEATGKRTQNLDLIFYALISFQETL